MIRAYRPVFVFTVPARRRCDFGFGIGDRRRSFPSGVDPEVVEQPQVCPLDRFDQLAGAFDEAGCGQRLRRVSQYACAPPLPPLSTSRWHGRSASSAHSR